MRLRKKLGKILMWPLKQPMLKIARGKYVRGEGLLRYPTIVNLYMQGRFEYVSDLENFGKVEYWQTATAMLQLERGDCEDFAEVARVLLKPSLKPFIIGIYAKLDKEILGHAVCMFMLPDGYYAYIDNGGYRWQAGLKIDRIAKEIAGQMYGYSNYLHYRVLKGESV